MVTNRSAAVFRAIADPTRREILNLLRGGRQTVGTIAANFRTSRPAISKHLRLLRSAGLVKTHKQGTASLCVLDAAPLRTVDSWLRDYEAFWGASLRGLKDYVEQTNPSGGDTLRQNSSRPAAAVSGRRSAAHMKEKKSNASSKRKRHHRSGNRD